MLDVKIDVGQIAGIDEDAKRIIMPRAVAAMREILLMLHGRLQEMLSRPGHGRFYRRRGRAHQASAPGEPPAPDSTEYRRSWHPAMKVSNDEVTGGLQSDLWEKFGRRLELGGIDVRGTYIAPRPHIRPVADDSQDEIEEILKRLL